MSSLIHDREERRAFSSGLSNGMTQRMGGEGGGGGGQAS